MTKTTVRQITEKRLAAGFLVLAVLFYCLSVGGTDLMDWRADLPPQPDAVEYAAAAQNLLLRGEPVIQVAGEYLPSRYPPGFSLLMAPVRALGYPLPAAPFVVNRICGLLLLLSLCFLLARERGPLAGGLAALLLAFLPAFVILSRSPMAEVPSALVLVWSGALTARYVASGKLGPAAAGAFLGGLSVLLKTSNGLFLPLLLCAPGFRPGRRLRDWAAPAAAALAGLLPTLLYQQAAFGSPLRTGYSLWVPYYAEISRAFQPGYLGRNLSYLLAEAAGTEPLTVASLYGWDSYFGPLLVVLAAVSAATFAWTRSSLFLLFCSGLYLAALGFYFFQDARLAFPVLVSAVALVASGSLPLLRRKSKLRSLWILLLALQLAGLAPVLRSGPRLKAESLDLLKDRTAQPEGCRWVQLAVPLLDPRGNLILTDLDMPYVDALIAGRAPARVFPARQDHHYRWNPDFLSLDRERIRREIESSLAKGETVLVVTKDALPQGEEQLLPPSLELLRLAGSDRAGGIYQIVSIGEDGCPLP